jgi:anion-transporting  ArsA/GET3 family ATPase
VGKRILLVSADPASNLDEMLGVALSNEPTPVPGVEWLWALNIDPERAADDYRGRVISPYRALWTEGQITELREQLGPARLTARARQSPEPGAARGRLTRPQSEPISPFDDD